MVIEKSTVLDLSLHMSLYQQAIAYQHALGNVNWVAFEDKSVREEIQAGLQYKMVVDGVVACVFMLVTSDPIIWRGRNEDPAIYIHRIAVNPHFRGQGFVAKIVNYVRVLAKRERKKYIRMDTTAGNVRLNSYYQQCGFTIVDTVKLQGLSDMPAHYQNNSFTLFEMVL